IPIARLCENHELSTVKDTPMLDSPPPFEHSLPIPGPPPNVLRVTETGSHSYWLSTRTAAPPTSGPTASQRFRTKTLFTILKRPPRTKIAPPPSGSSPLASPSAKVRFCTVSCGWSWSWQCGVVQTWAGSQVFMYRIRTCPPPLSVTFPPPSITDRKSVV